MHYIHKYFFLLNERNMLHAGGLGKVEYSGRLSGCKGTFCCCQCCHAPTLLYSLNIHYQGCNNSELCVIHAFCD